MLNVNKSKVNFRYSILPKLNHNNLLNLVANVVILHLQKIYIQHNLSNPVANTVNLHVPYIYKTLS